MATIILSILIFGTAGIITYQRIKKGESCEDCQTACPVKKRTIFTRITTEKNSLLYK